MAKTCEVYHLFSIIIIQQLQNYNLPNHYVVKKGLENKNFQ